MNVFVIGIGLIGGSIAIEIRNKWDNVCIFGVDENKENLKTAIELGLIDKEADLKEISTADMVIVSIPVDAVKKMLPTILDFISDNTLVLDVGSTKLKICQSVQKHPRRGNFIAAHPIAGTEFSGPHAAFKGLYKNKINIICEYEKTEKRFQQQAQELFNLLEMTVIYMDPKEHDKHIAYTSHLSHICSFMLGKTVLEKEKSEAGIFNLAGSGFESTVRLAKSSPEMWTPIFAENKENVIEALDEFINNLTRFKDALIVDDFHKVHQEMKNVNRISEILHEIKNRKAKLNCAL